MKYILILFFSYWLITFVVYESSGNEDSHVIKDRAAQAGVQLWRRHNCISCHSIYGKGGHLGADLTNVVSRRGTAYVRHVLKMGKGSMPRFPFHQDDVENLVSYLLHLDQLGTYPLKDGMSHEFFGHNSGQSSRAHD
ncbi:MAG: cytochrome c [Proteobacteria bacterium]|nr:cytochrome c [Pseudomonadota bacterium]